MSPCCTRMAPLSRLASLDDPPELLRTKHHVDVLHAELAQGVHSCRDEAWRRAEGAGLADALCAQRIDRRRRDGACKLEPWKIGCARKRVVHEGAGKQLTVVAVHDLFDHRLPD